MTVRMLAAAVPWKKIGVGLVKANAWLLAILKPLGAFGVLIVGIIDSSSIPMPLDAMVVEYVVRDHAKFLIYCFMGALGAAIGSLLPYYLGRAGGELFLLKRINRARYEQLRDRFEKQEFLAIMIPAMMPPPFPVKIFELAAGVFEMKPLWFFSALLLGKFVRFVIVALIIMVYGPTIFHTMMNTLHHHREVMLAGVGIFVLLLAVYVMRKVFDRRRGTSLPVEE
ncbi:YqaA family protein [Granulicella sp. L60]|uniref:YqaA family protein n=1 Tax=Granulicella sp. L60 TaxID=1641866 RepID=UPI0020B13F3E|nr:VTT domain-containing protein [Granulicella sp. L60]